MLLSHLFLALRFLRPQVAIDAAMSGSKEAPMQSLPFRAERERGQPSLEEIRRVDPAKPAPLTRSADEPSPAHLRPSSCLCSAHARPQPADAPTRLGKGRIREKARLDRWSGEREICATRTDNC